MKLLIPTRNRPESLSSVLTFLESFYPGTQVIVADGSSEEFKPRVEEAVAGFASLDLSFRSYPFDVSIFDRLLDVLEAESEEFIVMGADDDYPMMDTLSRGEAFLKANPDHVLAIGWLLVFDLQAQNELTARTSLTLPVTADDPLGRVRRYSQWPYPTSYSVGRRETLINRYQKSKKTGVGGVGDLVMGLLDCLQGKIHVVDDFSVIMTRNYSGSYLRMASKLDFLDKGPVIAEIARGFASDLESASGQSNEEAFAIASRIFGRHIGLAMANIKNHMHPQVLKSNLLENPRFISQTDAFERLFKAGTAEHQNYREKMLFITEALRNLARATGGETSAAGGTAIGRPAVVTSGAATTGRGLSDKVGQRIPIDPDALVELK